MPNPTIASQPLSIRCLALTASLETGRTIPECFSGLTGNFDKQGISFGVLQWNLGQGSLQPILKEMLDKHRDRMQEIFHQHLPALEAALDSTKEKLMEFALSIQYQDQHKGYVINEPWKGMFIALGRNPECQAIQKRLAQVRFNEALIWCKTYQLWSERAAALMFDIVVQNGSISGATQAAILGEFSRLPKDLSKDDLEVHKMVIIANLKAEASKKEYIEDVRKRKLCIANGKGVVHGNSYDLEGQFFISLKSYA
ncbi:MAG: peptidoglycan-binding protein [Nitrospirae bacterium]|nr:peptidoglycan-binding protein [Nitrospirota bacterium]